MIIIFFMAEAEALCQMYSWCILLLYTAIARNDINMKDGGWRVWERFVVVSRAALSDTGCGDISVLRCRDTLDSSR